MFPFFFQAGESLEGFGAANAAKDTSQTGSVWYKSIRVRAVKPRNICRGYHRGVLLVTRSRGDASGYFLSATLRRR